MKFLAKGATGLRGRRSAFYSVVPFTVTDLAPSFNRCPLAEIKSPLTVKSHLESVRLRSDFFSHQRMPAEVVNIHREHVESFPTDQLAHWKPAQPTTTAGGELGFLYLKKARWLK